MFMLITMKVENDIKLLYNKKITIEEFDNRITSYCDKGYSEEVIFGLTQYIKERKKANE